MTHTMAAASSSSSTNRASDLQLTSARASTRFSTVTRVPSVSSSSTSTTTAAGESIAAAKDGATTVSVTAASTTTTTTTTSSSDSAAAARLQDIRQLARGLERLSNARLQQQRYSPSQEKSENLSKLALGAKVERALGRRMTGQDAVLRPKSRILTEKA